MPHVAQLSQTFIQLLPCFVLMTFLTSPLSTQAPARALRWVSCELPVAIPPWQHAACPCPCWGLTETPCPAPQPSPWLHSPSHPRDRAAPGDQGQSISPAPVRSDLTPLPTDFRGRNNNCLASGLWGFHASELHRNSSRNILTIPNL